MRYLDRDGLAAMLHARRPEDLEGVAVYVYRASRSMDRRVFGEFIGARGELALREGDAERCEQRLRPVLGHHAREVLNAGHDDRPD